MISSCSAARRIALNFLESFRPSGTQSGSSTTAQAVTGPEATFFVFSDEAKAALDYFGYADPDAVERFEGMFEASALWCVRAADETTRVYQYRKVC